MDIKDLLKPEFEVHIVHNEKESYTKASGTTSSLLTALSVFVEALKRNDIDEEVIKYAVEQGLRDREELNSEMKKKIDELMKEISD